MTGTGRRRKPTTGEEEPRPSEASAPASTWSTHAAPPEPEYSYDWRQDSAVRSGQAAQDVPDGLGAAGYPGIPGTPGTPGGPTQQGFAQSVPQQSPYGSVQAEPPQYPSQPQQPPSQSQYAAPSYGSAPYEPPQQFTSPTFAPPPTQFPPPTFQPPPYQPPAETPYRPAARPSVPSSPHTSSTGYAPPGPADDDVAGLFDDDALFDDAPAARPEPIAPPPPSIFASTSTSTSTSTAKPGAEDEGERSPTKISSTAADYAFVDEETDEKDVKNWLTFVETRADTRAERSRRLRIRLIAAGAAAVVVIGGTLTYLWASGSPLLSTTTPATKNTLLLQVLDNNNDAVADAILVADKSTNVSGASADSTGHGAAVLIPSQMIVNSISTGSQPFGGDMTANPMVAPAGADTVANSLGVQVDGVWGLDESTFAVLIDSFGGVQLTTNAAVPAVNGAAAPTPGASASATASATATAAAGVAGSTATSPAVPLGSAKLTGAQAMAYALYKAPGEPISAQVNRFGQVLTAMLQEMPTTAELVTAYLNQLGVVYDPSLPESKVATILAQMAAEQQAGNFTVKALPLQDNSTNQLDFTAAGPIISSLLGGTVQSGLASGGTARILVQDATGESNSEALLIESAAQARLINGGYSYVGSDIVAKRSKSVIEIPTSSYQAAADEVAGTMGLPTSDVQVLSGMSEISDITVVLGADWVQIGMNG